MIGRCTECGKADAELARRDLCRPCYQRHWRAGTLPPAPVVVRTFSEPVETTRAHGLRSTYVVVGCRCEPCTDANTSQQRERSHQRTREAWGATPAAFVDAEPVRAHIRQLTDAGMGWKRVAAVANVPTSTVSAILYGKAGRPRQRVRRATAENLLAVASIDRAPAAVIDGTGAQRRLQALVATGWTQQAVAQHLGWTPANFGRLIHAPRPSVLPSTHDLACALYDELWQGPPPPENSTQASAITRARNLAKRYGWVPPLAWDDDTIDNPMATPNLGMPSKSKESRREDVLELLHAGTHPDVIPGRLGISNDAWSKWLDRNQDVRTEVASARARAGQSHLPAATATRRRAA